MQHCRARARKGTPGRSTAAAHNKSWNGAKMARGKEMSFAHMRIVARAVKPLSALHVRALPHERCIPLHLRARCAA